MVFWILTSPRSAWRGSSFYNTSRIANRSHSPTSWTGRRSPPYPYDHHARQCCAEAARSASSGEALFRATDGTTAMARNSGPSRGVRCRRAIRPTATSKAAVCYVRSASKPVKLIASKRGQARLISPAARAVQAAACQPGPFGRRRRVPAALAKETKVSEATVRRQRSTAPNGADDQIIRSDGGAQARRPASLSILGPP